jgi:hypothetical protein
MTSFEERTIALKVDAIIAGTLKDLDIPFALAPCTVRETTVFGLWVGERVRFISSTIGPNGGFVELKVDGEVDEFYPEDGLEKPIAEMITDAFTPTKRKAEEAKDAPESKRRVRGINYAIPDWDDEDGDAPEPKRRAEEADSTNSPSV